MWVQGHFISLVLLELLVVKAFLLVWEELLMHNFECVWNSVIFSFQSSKWSQDWVVYAFNKHNFLEWVVILYSFFLLIPSDHGLIGKRVTSRRVSGSFLQFLIIVAHNSRILRSFFNRLPLIRRLLDNRVPHHTVLVHQVGKELRA